MAHFDRIIKMSLWLIYNAPSVTVKRTTYHLDENFCRSIPEHYREGMYGGMSPVGCFVRTEQKTLEWEDCSVPTCKQFCSPYRNCDINQCIDDGDSTGIYYRGQTAKTRSGETCFPWKEVRDTQVSYDMWGRKTESYNARYKLV